MIIFGLLLAVAAPAAYHPVAQPSHHRKIQRRVRHRRQIDARLNLAGCGYSATGLCATARSPYRLPIDAPTISTAKADALRQTGQRCALIGQTLCPSRTRTIVHVEQ